MLWRMARDQKVTKVSRTCWASLSPLTLRDAMLIPPWQSCTTQWLRYTRPVSRPLAAYATSAAAASSVASSPLDGPDATAQAPHQLADTPKAKAKADWKRRAVRHSSQDPLQSRRLTEFSLADLQEGSNFIDQLNLTVVSGRGGAGGVAFHREKFVVSRDERDSRAWTSSSPCLDRARDRRKDLPREDRAVRADPSMSSQHRPSATCRISRERFAAAQVCPGVGLGSPVAAEKTSSSASPSVRSCAKCATLPRAKKSSSATTKSGRTSSGRTRRTRSGSLKPTSATRAGPLGRNGETRPAGSAATRARSNGSRSSTRRRSTSTRLSRSNGCARRSLSCTRSRNSRGTLTFSAPSTNSSRSCSSARSRCPGQRIAARSAEDVATAT